MYVKFVIFIRSQQMQMTPGGNLE